MKLVTLSAIALLSAVPARATTPDEALRLLLEANLAVMEGSILAGAYEGDVDAIRAWEARGFEIYDKAAAGR